MEKDSWYSTKTALTKMKNTLKRSMYRLRWFGLPLAIVSVFFISGIAKAESVYQSASVFTPLAASCFQIDTSGLQSFETSFCDLPSEPKHETYSIGQELYINQSVQISAVSMFLNNVQDNGANRPYEITGYLLNGANVVATSTTTFTQPQETMKFVFTPYTVSDVTPVTNFVMQIIDTGFPSGEFRKFNVTMTPNRYPPNYVNPAFFSGGYSYTTKDNWLSNVAQLSDHSDFAIIVYVSDDVEPLRITYPASNSIVNDYPLTTRGTCSNPVDLSFYSGFATSTPDFGISLLCNSSAFAVNYNPFQGDWHIHASSSGEAADSFFYFLAQSQETISSTTPTSTIANSYLNLDCSSFPVMQFFCDYAHRFVISRPFSYVPQIAFTFWDALDATPSTTVEWIPAITVAGKIGNATTTYVLPALSETTMTDNFPTEKAKPIRDVSTIAISLGILFEIFALRSKVL